METIECIGRDSMERTYEVTFYKDGKELCFQVFTIPQLTSGEFFEMNLEIIDENTLKIILMDHHNISNYEAMGIPEALIAFISNKEAKTIMSSSNRNVSDNEYSLRQARKVWKRLVAKNLAIYDDKIDAFIYKPEQNE